MKKIRFNILLRFIDVYVEEVKLPFFNTDFYAQQNPNVANRS